MDEKKKMLLKNILKLMMFWSSDVDIVSHRKLGTAGQERVTLKNCSLKVDGVEIDSYKPPQTIFYAWIR